MIADEAYRAVQYLLISGLVAFVYGIGFKGLETKQETGIEGYTFTGQKDQTKKAVLNRLVGGFGVIIVIALAAGYVFLGTSSDCSDADPIYGGCTTTTEYTPSDNEKMATSVYFVILLGAPYLLGGMKKYQLTKNAEK